MPFSGTSIPDPARLVFDTPPGSQGSGFAWTAKTRTSSAINTGIKNLILITAGQSNVCNNAGAAYTITNTGKIDNLSIYDGAIYVGGDPLLGTAQDGATLGPGNFATRLADKLITAGKFDRVIIVPIGYSATGIADWATGNQRDRFSVAWARLKNLNITPGTNVTFVVLWGQGENDTQLGTSQSTYQTLLGTVITNARNAGLPSTVPWFIAQQSGINISGSFTTSSAVTAAQAAIVNHGNAIWAGPNADSIGTGSRQADLTHWTPTGSDTYAGLWQTSLAAFGAPF